MARNEFRPAPVGPSATSARQRFVVKRSLPLTLRIAFWIWVTLETGALIVLLVRVATMDWDAYLAEQVHSFVSDGQQLEVAPGLAIGTFILSAGMTLLGIAARTTLAFLLRRGLTWVRVLLTIFGALQLTNIVIGFNALALIETVATAAAVVLLWLPSSNTYFREVTADRRVHRSRQFSNAGTGGLRDEAGRPL